MCHKFALHFFHALRHQAHMFRGAKSSRWKKLQHNSYLRIWKHKIQEQIYSVKIYFLHFIDENQRNRTLTDRSCNYLPTFSVTFSDNSAAFWPASAVNFQPTWEWTEMKTLFYERSTFIENYATMLIGWQKSSSLFIGKRPLSVCHLYCFVFEQYRYMVWQSVWLIRIKTIRIRTRIWAQHFANSVLDPT